MYKCDKCEKEFDTPHKLGGHKSSHNRGESYRNKRETDKSKEKKDNKNKPKKCKYCNKEFDNGYKMGGHIVRCKKNPNYEIIKEKRILKQTGKPLSEDHKKNVSNGMKKAHSEGRAWNIGKSRWNNEPSYPEKFFIKVIKNEFNNKNYKREFSFSKYSLDFAWVNEKLCIEIDGSQHERFEEYKERDKRKDLLLEEKGWKVLRIKWKDMFNDPKKWIEISKKFIESN